MAKDVRNLTEPLALVSATFLGGNMPAASYRLQVITHVIGFTDAELKHLALVIVECR